MSNATIGRSDRRSGGASTGTGKGRGGATSTGRKGGRRGRSPGGPRRRLRGPAWLSRWRTRSLLLWTALVLVLAGGLVFLFFFSAAFVVEDVRASGARDEVNSSALELAGLPEGRPVARVSAGRVSDRVLEDPRIASVEVQREWPSGVNLVVTERQPAIALRGRGSTWLADAGGVVYEEVDEASRRLPLISVRTDPPEVDEATVRGLVELWRTRPDPAALGGELEPPRLNGDGEVEMALQQVTLLWGAPIENEKKWQVVAALLEQETIDPEGAFPLTVDVRLPDTPVVTGLPAAEAP